MSEKLNIKIAQFEGMTEVERDPEESKRVKADGDLVDVGWRVLGVPFGGLINGRDSDGETFTPETDTWLKAGDKVNITFYHGFDPDSMGKRQEVPALIGRATYVETDERGLWFEPMLDASEPYAQRLMKADLSDLRASSGAVSHLVRKADGGIIKTWPVGELALFDTNEWRKPANELAVIEAKAKDLTEAIPEAVEAVDAVEVQEIAETIKTSIQDHKEIKMDEILEPAVEKPAEEKVDIKAIADEIRKSIVEELKAEKGEPKGNFTVTAKPKESASFSKALMAWAQGDNPRGFKGNDFELKGAWQGQTDNEGGYAVPDDFYNRIIEQRQDASWVRKAPVMRFVTERDRILIPTEATAGTKLVVTAEEAAYDENEPVFGQVALTIHKFTKMIKVSEEMLDGDAVGLEAYIASVVARASAASENYYCTVGTGTGMPQGVLAGATASGITTAAQTAITAAEVVRTMGSVGSQYHNSSSGFLMLGSTKFYIQGLTGNNFMFIPTPAGGDIMGYPVYISPDMEAISNTKKSILFGDFSMYAFAEREGITLSRNPYLYQANGQVGLFVKQRFGGAVLQTLAFKYLTQGGS